MKRAALLTLCAALAAAFAALGVWQVERRAWKHALVAAVEDRLHAAPAPAPGPAAWPAITAAKDGYRRVTARGAWIERPQGLVAALTEAGQGYWAMAPLRTDAGFVVLVNRGFVPAALRDAAHAGPTGRAEVTGPLRPTEPGGQFLRANSSDADRWYSRDVVAIAARRGIRPVAPYFIDAEAGLDPAAWPRGGMTVVTFPDNHALYALTWFALAGLSLYGLIRVWRFRRSAPAAPRGW